MRALVLTVAILLTGCACDHRHYTSRVLESDQHGMYEICWCEDCHKKVASSEYHPHYELYIK